MSERLAGKVALITGAAQGQGAAEARRFAAEGAKVVVADVQYDLARTMVSEIGVSSAMVAPLDVTDPVQMQELVDIYREAFTPHASTSVALQVCYTDATLAQAERRLIELALRRARGNRSRAAELLGVNRQRLLRRMEHGLSRWRKRVSAPLWSECFSRPRRSQLQQRRI